MAKGNAADRARQQAEKANEVVNKSQSISCAAKKPCVKDKESNKKLAKATAVAIKKTTGKEVDAMATEKSPFEGQPYMTSANISRCKSLAYNLENSGVLRRFNRYREAIPYAYAAADMNELGDESDNDTKREERKEKCLTMLPESAKELNKALGLPEGTIKDKDLRDDTTGFRAAVYRSEPDGKLILVARDTQPKSLVDWKTNTDNGQGSDTDQYKSMRNLTSKLNDKGIKFDVAGYSKGGGLAQEAGLISTNSKIMVFNSAGLPITRTGQASSDSLAARTQSFSAEGDFLTYMNDTTDPSQQIVNARFLRDELAGKRWWEATPINIKYRNPAMKKAKDEARREALHEAIKTYNGMYGGYGGIYAASNLYYKDPDPDFAKAKKEYLEGIDEMIKIAKEKQDRDEQFCLFPSVMANNMETVPNSIPWYNWESKVKNGNPNLAKLIQHQMSNVTNGLEKTIKQDKQTLQNFVKECG